MIALFRGKGISLKVGTGNVAGGATTNIVVPLGRVMPDTSYAVAASVEDANGELRLACIVARAVDSVTVRVQNVNTLTARNGTIHLLVQA